MSRKLTYAVALVLSTGLSGCSSIGQPGSVTIAGRGAVLTGEHGDPLLDTGEFSKRVPKEWAMGYHKGISDAGWRDYWSLQDAQALRPKPSNNNNGNEGHINYYPISVPEGVDGDGVIRAPRNVVVPITE
jgi:hypothetical protein